jgi:hypothetical protein
MHIQVVTLQCDFPSCGGAGVCKDPQKSMNLAPTPCTINARNAIGWFSISCRDPEKNHGDLLPYDLMFSGPAKDCWTEY